MIVLWFFFKVSMSILLFKLFNVLIDAHFSIDTICFYSRKHAGVGYTNRG